MAAETAQQVILGDTKLRILAELFAQMVGRAVKEMRRPLGEIIRVNPARSDQRPIDVVFDHALKRPGLRTRLQTERRVEVEAIFAFNMRADEGGIGDAFGVIDDIGQLPLGRGRRHRLLLAVGKAGHPELDFRLGHKRADFRQAEASAEAIKSDQLSSPDFLADFLPDFASKRFRLAIPCCHRGVSSGDIVVQKSRP